MLLVKRQQLPSEASSKVPATVDVQLSLFQGVVPINAIIALLRLAPVPSILVHAECRGQEHRRRKQLPEAAMSPYIVHCCSTRRTKQPPHP